MPWTTGELIEVLSGICPIDSDSMWMGDPMNKATWNIPPAANATSTQRANLDTAIAGLDVNGGEFRSIAEIYTDVNALTGQQKTNAWNDLSSGTPKKYYLDRGPNAAAIIALDWAITDSGATGNSLLAAKTRLIAMYTADNPGYLFHPPFDPSISVGGLTGM